MAPGRPIALRSSSAGWTRASRRRSFLTDSAHISRVAYPVDHYPIAKGDQRMPSERLAADGGTPVRSTPFTGPSHDFGEDDIEALAEVVRSGNMSKGAKVRQF